MSGIHLEKSPRGRKSTSEDIVGGGGGGGRIVGSIQFGRVTILKGGHKIFTPIERSAVISIIAHFFSSTKAVTIETIMICD